MRKCVWLFVLTVFGCAFCPALTLADTVVTPAETYIFHVRSNISYRCYEGDGQVKAVDSRTHAVCDNKTINKTLIDENVSIKITDEPTPDDSKNLAGDWIREVNFKGRKFTVALTLFKTVPADGGYPYRLRAVAEDDEPTTRHNAVFIDSDAVARFSPLYLDYVSSGQPEEITLSTFVAPVAAISPNSGGGN